MTLQPFYCRTAQRFALAAGGRAGIRLGSRKKPEARKMPENGAESHQSAARFVGLLLGFMDSLLVKL
jgi:alkanesulfonate monooxygenase SsuD/methylene tetrahydromethanopterin reductase-like flavin-dependent oxidoreductase (luciferase family)